MRRTSGKIPKCSFPFSTCKFLDKFTLQYYTHNNNKKTWHICTIYAKGGRDLEEALILKNRLKDARTGQKLSQAQLAQMVGVSRNTISSIETGQFNPTAKLALLLCIALEKKFEDLFYF